jgi:3-phenylpropionate/trans-cinnamate dioxygenase ferredoxin reductase subunit
MNAARQVVIVGAGLAGANAAFALRDEGFEGRIVIVGDENEMPYERPPLSKSYLRGEDPIEKAHVRPESDYQTNQIELLRGHSALSLDLPAPRVATTAGYFAYDALVIATGAEPRRLGVPGADLDGVHYLRTRLDADRLRAAAANANNIVVVGGGWLGSEVAASLRQLERPVTFLISRPRPLEPVLGSELAQVYRQVHEEHAVHFVVGRVTALRGTERVEQVETDAGERLAADLVVVGVGAAPRIALAEAAGLRLRHGAIEVDELLRTSAPDVYAIGDVASAWNPRYGRPIRVEHWDNAINQGKAVAATILGRGKPYDRVPYLYSDQYDLGMEYRGFAPEWDDLVIRGDLERREFHAFWLAGGQIAAAMNVNLWEDGDVLQALVESGRPVDLRVLADVDAPLAQAA